MAENLDKIKEVEENGQKSGQDQGGCTSDKSDVAAQHDVNETRPISGVVQVVQEEDEVSLENISNQIQLFKNQLGPHDKTSVGLSEKPKQKKSYGIVYWADTEEFNVMALNRLPQNCRKVNAEGKTRAEGKLWNIKVVKIGGNKDLLENDVKSLIQKMESSGAIGSTSHPPTAETNSVPKSKNKQPVTSKNKENAPKQRKRKPKPDDDSLEIKKTLSETKLKKGNTEKKRPSQSEKAALLKAKNAAANLAGLQFLQSSGLIQSDQDSLNLPRPITQNNTHSAAQQSSSQSNLLPTINNSAPFLQTSNSSFVAPTAPYTSQMQQSNTLSQMQQFTFPSNFSSTNSNSSQTATTHFQNFSGFQVQNPTLQNNTSIQPSYFNHSTPQTHCNFSELEQQQTPATVLTTGMIQSSVSNTLPGSSISSHSVSMSSKRSLNFMNDSSSCTSSLGGHSVRTYSDLSVNHSHDLTDRQDSGSLGAALNNSINMIADIQQNTSQSFEEDQDIDGKEQLAQIAESSTFCSNCKSIKEENEKLKIENEALKVAANFPAPPSAVIKYMSNLVHCFEKNSTDNENHVSRQAVVATLKYFGYKTVNDVSLPSKKMEKEEFGMELFSKEYIKIKDPNELISKGNLTDSDK